MEMIVTTSGGEQLKTTRCPIRFNGKPLRASKGAPLLGEHTQSIIQEFELSHQKNK